MIPENLDYLTVGHNRYIVELMNPLESIELGGRDLSLFGPFLGRRVLDGDVSLLHVLGNAKPEPEDLCSLQNTIGNVLVACGSLNGKEAADMFVEAMPLLHARKRIAQGSNRI